LGVDHENWAMDTYVVSEEQECEDFIGCDISRFVPDAPYFQEEDPEDKVVPACSLERYHPDRFGLFQPSW